MAGNRRGNEGRHGGRKPGNGKTLSAIFDTSLAIGHQITMNFSDPLRGIIQYY